ncbi:MAG: WD40 repeat domain-containing protein [Planctomycetales bacterium]
MSNNVAPRTCGIAIAAVIGIMSAHAVEAAGGEQPGEFRVLEGHGDKVTCLALSADGKRLVSGSDDKTVRVWDLAAGKEVHAFRDHANFVLDLAISPDGRRALSGSGGEFQNGRFVVGNDRSLRLWDLDRKEQLLKLEGHAAPVWSVRFLAEGRQAISVSGDPDFAVRVWDLEGGKELRRIGGRQHSGQGVAVSADGRLLFTGAPPPDAGGRLWDVETGKELRRLTGPRAMIRGAAFSPDGKRLLTGGGNFVKGGLDTALRLWDVETGRELRRFEGHQELVWCVAFSIDGRKALSGSVDGTIRLWDVETGKELHRFEGHQVIETDPRVGPRADVRAVLFTPDGKQAVSAGHDKTVRVWTLPE